MKLEVLCGMIGSGKTVYARKRADEGAIVVCHDSLTESLHGRYRYEQGLRACYREIEQSTAWAALSAGRDVVVDRTHLTAESRERWIRWRDTYVGLQTFNGHGPTVRVIAVAFPICEPSIHAVRRFEADPRGRSLEDWTMVARHHAEQAAKEPLSDSEGFDEIIRMEDTDA
jgi:hypothetical protein